MKFYRRSEVYRIIWRTPAEFKGRDLERLEGEYGTRAKLIGEDDRTMDGYPEIYSFGGYEIAVNKLGMVM